MNALEPILFCWSGGKDSAMALHALLQQKQFRIVSLLTTVTETYDRIAMHGVRRDLLKRQPESIGMTALFPIWKRDTRQLIRHFHEQRFRAIAACIDSKVLDPSFAGRELDESFFRDLPPHADPCGENGEFPTFVRSEEHTSELQSQFHLVCRLLLEKKK